MMVYDPQKTICPERIPRGGTTRLTIRFRAAGKLMNTDLVLAMDRSGSMGGQPLCRASQAAISMVKRFTQCEEDCCLPGKSRLGLISYADRAAMEVPLETCTLPTQKALQQLKAGGNTNHQAALELAGEMLSGSRAGRKILILFTDGTSNCGCPEAAARKLREQGVEIYCIGLGVEACYLKNLASQPWKDHLALAENLCALDSAFRNTEEKIMGTGLKAKLREQVGESFQIERILPPKQGKVLQLDRRTLEWVLETGVNPDAGPFCLELDVRHTGCETGCFPINASLSYEDQDHHCLVFPNPTIEITKKPGGDCCCGGCCAVAEPCRDGTECCCGETRLTGLGRVVEVKALIRDVCPGRRVGAAVILTEVDLQGREHSLGMKTYEIPAQTGEGCRDVELPCVQFVVPESTRVWGDCESLCSPRCFRARVIANYLDTDYQCCESLCEL